MYRHCPILVALATASTLACGSGEGRPDEELHGLVHAEEKAPDAVDLDRAANEVAEFGRALAQPHAALAEAIGPHQFRSKSSVVVTEDGKTVEELSYENSIQLDSNRNYHALSNNSQDYGREVYFVADTLYLRPRYAPVFHQRPPVDEKEPGRILDELFGDLGAYFDVVAAGAELVDRGHAEVSGRAGRKVEIKAAPETADRPAEQAAQRKWRNDVEVRAVKGEVVLDAESASPLLGHLDATAAFIRDGRRFEMKLTVRHEVADIGSTPAVEAPAGEIVVSTPEHNREVFEREQLLKGIAPPARKAPTPSSAEESASKK